MKQAFILLVSIAMVFVAPGAQGTAHLSLSNVTANVTRTGCGTTRLCVETPADCDPATDDPCLFTSVRAPNGTTLYFKLSGTVSGDSYVAVARTANASEGTSMLYACGRNGTTSGVSGRFFFQVVQRNNANGSLTVIYRNVTGIQNSITNTTIQCVFHVPGVNASMVRNTVLLLGSGMVNGGSLGSFTANVTTPPLNLSNPASNVNPTTPTPSTTPTTSSLNITRTGCGDTKLCVETPEDCDPATNDTCLFTSVNASAPMPPNGTTLSFELSGTISGDAYVGVALGASASQGTSMLYACGRNGTTNGVNGTFFFQAAQINNANGAVTVMNGRATGIQSLLTDTKIQCAFYIPGVNASMARNADTTFALQIGSGSVNGGSLGSFTANVTTPPLNLANPASNVNNTNPTTTTSSLNITRTGCGTTKLCVETPEDCDPATNDTCLFVSVRASPPMPPNGTTLSFELSGTISGNGFVGVALGASASQGTSMLYACGRIGATNGVNGRFIFLAAQINNANGALTIMNGRATGIQSLLTDTKIQCAFDIPGVGAEARTTTFALQLGSGSANGSSLGSFTANVTTPPLNLANPASNVNNTNTTTTTPTTTTTTTTSSLNITRTGCGATKLCVEAPEDCDPATNDTCLFVSVRARPPMPPNGTTLYFELSGTISGDAYVGVALGASASEGTSMLYACGRNGTTNGVNGTFFFLAVQINNTNGALTVVNGRATGIQNLITDTKIQCVFHVPGVNASMARNADTTFTVQLGSGRANGSTLGPFTANVTTPPLNLLDPTSNLNNNITTTTSPTTMSGANRALFPQALLLLLSIFILYILKTA